MESLSFIAKNRHISLSFFVHPRFSADPNLLFGPYDWNPGEGSKKYCSWDSATEKACNTHNYEQGLIHLVHAAGAEIYPSLGGWTLSDAFVGMAASATARARFTQNCVDLIKEYDFDGKK